MTALVAFLVGFALFTGGAGALALWFGLGLLGVGVCLLADRLTEPKRKP